LSSTESICKIASKIAQNFLSLNTTLQVSLTTDDLQLLIKNAVQEALKSLSTPDEKYLTRKEAADALSITLPTLHAYSLAGTIKAYRLGRKVRYKKSELDSALKLFNLKVN